MDGSVIVLDKDGVQILHDVDDEDLLRVLQQTVDGFIEIVYPQGLSKPYLMVVNEEGLLRGMDLNPIASALYGIWDHGFPIVGPAVICKQILTADGPDIGPLEEADIPRVMDIIWRCI